MRRPFAFECSTCAKLTVILPDVSELVDAEIAK